MPRWIKCPSTPTRARLLLNLDQHTRLEGRVQDGVATLYAYDMNDVDGKEYSIVFQTTDVPKAAAVFDRLVTFLAAPAPISLVFDVVAEAALL